MFIYDNARFSTKVQMYADVHKTQTDGDVSTRDRE